MFPILLIEVHVFIVLLKLQITFAIPALKEKTVTKAGSMLAHCLQH